MKLSEVRNFRPEILDGYLERAHAGFGRDFDLTALQERVIRCDAAYGLHQGDGSVVGKNLLIAGPTSSGKTLATEILMANHLQRDRVRPACVYAVPLRALAEEKWSRFRKVFAGTGEEGVFISSSDHQEYDRYILRGRFRIAVVVYEKLYSWLIKEDARRMLERKVGLVIVDELQMLANEERGPKLELLLTFLLDLQSQRVQHYQGRGVAPRVVGLGPSKTALGPTAEWLGAETVWLDDSERPIPLLQYVVNGDGCVERAASVCNHGAGYETETIGMLARDLATGQVPARPVERLVPIVRRVEDRHPGVRILVYWKARRLAEDFAHALARRRDPRAMSKAEKAELDTRREYSTREGLFDCLERGVAYHHGGMAAEERHLVERMMREDRIHVVACTPTLAMGVNLDVDWVIFSSLETGGHGGPRLEPLDYRNFAGRAGRMREDGGNGATGVALVLVTSLTGEELRTRVVRPYFDDPLGPVEPKLAVKWRPEQIALAGMAWNARQLAGTLNKSFTKRSKSCPGLVLLNGELVDMTEASQKVTSELADELVERDLDAHAGAIAPQGVPQPTAVGAELAAAGLQVTTFALLKQLTEGMPGVLEQPLVLLETLCRCEEAIEMITARPPKPGELQELRHDIRVKYEGEARGSACSYLVERPVAPSDATFRRIRATLVARAWVDGVPAREILSRYRLDDFGQCERLTDQLAWVAGAFRTIFDKLGRLDDEPERKAWVDSALGDFEERLRFGVASGVVGVARLRVEGTNRERLMKLWEAMGGWDHPTRLLAHPQQAFPKKLSDWVKVLQRAIREREWSDDPRTPQEKQISLVLQERHRYNIVNDADRLIESLYRAKALAEVADVAAEMLSRKPFGRIRNKVLNDVFLGKTPGYLRIAGCRSGAGTAELGALFGCIGPDRGRPQRVIAIGGDDWEMPLAAEDLPRDLLYLSRAAFAQIFASGIASHDDEEVMSRIRHLLDEENLAIGTADEIDRRIGRERGVRVGAGASTRQRVRDPLAGMPVDARVQWRVRRDGLLERVRGKSRTSPSRWAENVEQAIFAVTQNPIEAARNVRIVMEGILGLACHKYVKSISGTLAGRLEDLRESGVLPQPLNEKLDRAKKIGNRASHDDPRTCQPPQVTLEEAQEAATILVDLFEWFLEAGIPDQLEP